MRLRADADLPYALETIGTGAPVTTQRLRAVELALAGKTAEEIAAGSGLPAARVEQVIENVIARGTAALYLNFEEVVPLPDGITEATFGVRVQELIRRTPPDVGVRTSHWTQSIVAEYVVQQGWVPDVSATQMQTLIWKTMGENRPPSYSDDDKVPEGGGASSGKNLRGTLLGLGISIVFAGFIALGWTQQGFSLGLVAGTLFVALFVFVMLVATLKALAELRVKRSLSRVAAPVWAVEARKAAVAAAAAEPVHAHPVRPLPAIKMVHAYALPACGWETRAGALTDAANALGKPPTPVQYLWVFAAQNDQRSLETEGWPQIGPVHLLVNATSLTLNQLAGGGAQKLIARDEDGLKTRLAAVDEKAGEYQRPDLFMTMSLGGKHPYRGYPIHTMLCADAVWQAAFEGYASRCRLAVVNLSGFNPQHPGLGFEVRHLFAGGPPQQFVFLYSPGTLADAAIDCVLDLWQKLEAEPASLPELLFVRVPDSQDAGYGLQFGGMPMGTGWLAKIQLAREGAYVPVAGRIVEYLRKTAAA